MMRTILSPTKIKLIGGRNAHVELILIMTQYAMMIRMIINPMFFFANEDEEEHDV